MTKLRVLHVVPGFFPAVRYGGPTETALRLCQALAPLVDLEVMTTNADGADNLDAALDRIVDVQGVPVRYFDRWPRTNMVFSASMVRTLFERMSEFDIVHVTGGFCAPPIAACAAARLKNRPYIVSPRGNLRAWAMRHKRWKKLPYWYLVERQNLSRAAGIHVTSELEAADIQSLLPSSRPFLLPNGVVLPEQLPPVERSAKRVVFLGRLHAVKALDQLVRAASILTAATPELELVLAGPDDVGEWHRLSKIIGQLRPRPSVRYLGAVNGLSKSELLASAGMLVLPSHSENFGQVVIEALAHQTPVVASQHTPWRVLEEREAGFWVPNDAASLAGAMRRLIDDPRQARQMGERGQALAREYEWGAIAKNMVATYEALVVSWRRAA